MHSSMTTNSLPVAVPRPRFKVEHIQRILELRIQHGDYQGRELPTERELAVELSVSRTTARKAVQRLIDRRLLERRPNGRVALHRKGSDGLRLAFLVPSLSSQDIQRWRLAVERVAESFHASVRTMLYVHWDDPVIVEALESYDGTLITMSCEEVPQRILHKLRSAGRNVAVLGRDLSAAGIPSVDLFPPAFLQRLLDHLADQGHRGVDCFNIQTIDPVVQSRIEQWNLWRAVHRFGGRLLGMEIRAYDEPITQAYEQAGRLFDGKGGPAGNEGFTASAILCTTAPAAIGVLRAMHDRRMTIGAGGISVCVVNDEGLGRFMSPSLTSIEMPDPRPYLSVCMEWLQRSGEGWVGSLLLQPRQVPLFIGESTGPAKPA
jgi:DNA-binding LacI/PurR family transcriptional regulator